MVTIKYRIIIIIIKNKNNIQTGIIIKLKQKIVIRKLPLKFSGQSFKKILFFKLKNKNNKIIFWIINSNYKLLVSG
jgi:hypothetical protein